MSSTSSQTATLPAVSPAVYNFRISGMETMNNAQGTTAREMPRYQSHKLVWALKIKEITLANPPTIDELEKLINGEEYHGDEEIVGAVITPEEEGYAAFPVSRRYVLKHSPQVGGYYVVYSSIQTDIRVGVRLKHLKLDTQRSDGKHCIFAAVSARLRCRCSRAWSLGREGQGSAEIDPIVSAGAKSLDHRPDFCKSRSRNLRPHAGSEERREAICPCVCAKI
jgi:hypothetical protein